MTETNSKNLEVWQYFTTRNLFFQLILKISYYEAPLEAESMMSRTFQKPHVLLFCDCKKAFAKTPAIYLLICSHSWKQRCWLDFSKLRDLEYCEKWEERTPGSPKLQVTNSVRKDREKSLKQRMNTILLW